MRQRDWDHYWKKYLQKRPEEGRAQEPLDEPREVRGPLPEFYVGKSVLDYGCGIGRLGRDIAQFCAEYTGVDVSADAIELARKLVPRHARFYNFIDLPNVRFDRIICRDVLIHLGPEPVREALENFKTWLKPDGRVWCDFFPEYSQASHVVRPVDIGKYTEYVVQYTQPEIEAMCAEAGFVADITALETRYVCILRHA